MKLTIAAGILAARTLPVRSDESSEPLDIVAVGRSVLKSEPILTTMTKHHPQQEQRPGTKARAGGASFFHRHRSEAKLLVNRASPRPNGKTTFCDPSSEDADVGMLSCGVGYECIVDEASTLGGVCASSTSRQLQQENEICYLCPVGFTLGQVYYGTIIEDTESGYGGKTCGDTINPAYQYVSFDASTCETVASAVQAAGCCVPMCQLCDMGSHAPYASENAETVVEGISLPGYDNAITCANLTSAAYFTGFIDVYSCSASRQAAIEAGCCEKLFCTACDAGSYIPPADSLNSTACDALRPQALTYYNTTLSEDECVAASQLAVEESCCIPRPMYNVCNICGNATFYPDNFVFRLGTCDYVQSASSANACASYGSIFAAFCCGKAETGQTTEVPGPTPVPDSNASSMPVSNAAPTPDSNEAPTSPPSAAMSWSSAAVVSTLTIVGTFSAMGAGFSMLDWN